MRKHILAIILVLVSAFLVVATVSASPPGEISGTFNFAGVDPDGNSMFAMSGPISGTAVEMAGPGAAATLYCHCTINGHGDDDVVVFRLVAPAGTPGAGKWTILGGTGILGTVHGQGQWTFDESTLTGTYGGQVHFDPAHH